MEYAEGDLQSSRFSNNNPYRDEELSKLKEQVDILRRERDDYKNECVKLKQILKIKSEAQRERHEAIQRLLNAQMLESGIPDLIERSSLTDIYDFRYYGILRPVQPQKEREDAETLYSDITTVSAEEATDDKRSQCSASEKMIDHHEESASVTDYSVPKLPPRPRGFSNCKDDNTLSLSEARSSGISRSEATLRRNYFKKPNLVKRLFSKSKKQPKDNLSVDDDDHAIYNF